MSTAAYRHAAAISEGIRQTAIRDAEDDYKVIQEDAPRLVKSFAGSSPSPADTAETETKVNAITADAMAGRDRAVHKAEADHRDRLAAAGQHYGVSNGIHDANPDAPAAQAWLGKITQ